MCSCRHIKHIQAAHRQFGKKSLLITYLSSYFVMIATLEERYEGKNSTAGDDFYTFAITIKYEDCVLAHMLVVRTGERLIIKPWQMETANGASVWLLFGICFSFFVFAINVDSLQMSSKIEVSHFFYFLQQEHCKKLVRM